VRADLKRFEIHVPVEKVAEQSDPGKAKNELE